MGRGLQQHSGRAFWDGCISGFREKWRGDGKVPGFPGDAIGGAAASRSLKDTSSMIAFLSILAVGFFLGMRHATDPDHVIAVTTIVSNQRGGMRAAWIGAFWGLGHTLTILVVGAGIIAFNLVIPVRLGLSMELSVAVMLIVLGVMNIAAFVRSMPLATHGAEHEAIVHTHPHRHGHFVHTHPHSHEPEGHSPLPTGSPLARLDRAL